MFCMLFTSWGGFCMFRYIRKGSFRVSSGCVAFPDGTPLPLLWRCSERPGIQRHLCLVCFLREYLANCEYAVIVTLLLEKYLSLDVIWRSIEQCLTMIM